MAGKDCNAAASGGAIYNANGDVDVQSSVFTDNHATVVQGGAVYSLGSGSFAIGSSVFANNTSAVNGATNAHLRNLGATYTNLGNNLVDENSTGVPFFFSTSNGDHIGAVHYVVTGLTDTVDHDNDETVLSLREAVILSNDSATGAEIIWLPAWTFRLTIPGPTLGDMDAAFGDLDVTDPLTVRGIASDTTVDGSAIAVDAVFDLLGDFNGDGQVDSLDYNLFSSGDPLADANEDGIVDVEDFDIWDANRFNTLTLINVT